MTTSIDVIVCVPDSSGIPSGVCPTGTTHKLQTMTLTVDNPVNINPVDLAGFFSFAFFSTLVLYYSVKPIGLLINFLKKYL